MTRKKRLKEPNLSQPGLLNNTMMKGKIKKKRQQKKNPMLNHTSLQTL
jgi:hypothetical protein